MKKRIVILMAVLAVLGMIFACGCAEEKPQPRSKYAVFKNAWGSEEYRVSEGGTETVEFEYDEEKEYRFEYEIFYSDNNSYTGESSSGYGSIKANKPGTYDVFAHYKYNGMEVHSVLKVIIKEKPLITPEVRFDPNGATVEERDGETIYVYEYDGKEHFPMIQVFYENEQIDLELNARWGVGNVILNGEYYKHAFPRDKGIYSLTYTYDYKNKVDQDKYSKLQTTITVEIR